ncbi:MAG: hypothetical protein MKZ95_18055, partial [Pirellulales bacterium]|nr:hypothetical protein [Pirellulales bacterium]
MAVIENSRSAIHYSGDLTVEDSPWRDRWGLTFVTLLPSNIQHPASSMWQWETHCPYQHWNARTNHIWDG